MGERTSLGRILNSPKAVTSTDVHQAPSIRTEGRVLGWPRAGQHTGAYLGSFTQCSSRQLWKPKRATATGKATRFPKSFQKWFSLSPRFQKRFPDKKQLELSPKAWPSMRVRERGGGASQAEGRMFGKDWGDATEGQGGWSREWAIKRGHQMSCCQSKKDLGTSSGWLGLSLWYWEDNTRL